MPAVKRKRKASTSRTSRTNTNSMGLSKWTMYGGGTGAAPGKNSYDIRRGGRKYSIQPHTTMRGRHAGYLLSVFPGQGVGHAGINASGNEVMINSSASNFRTAASAARAAAAHMRKSG